MSESRVGPPRLILFHCGMFKGLILMQAFCREPQVQWICQYSSCVMSKIRLLQRVSPASNSATFLALFLKCFLSFRGSDINILYWAEHLMVIILNTFLKQLWTSASTQCKRKLLRQKLWAELICGYKYEYLEHSLTAHPFCKMLIFGFSYMLL